jgi:hypothetical protein
LVILLSSKHLARLRRKHIDRGNGKSKYVRFERKSGGISKREEEENGSGEGV